MINSILQVVARLTIGLIILGFASLAILLTVQFIIWAGVWSVLIPFALGISYIIGEAVYD